MARTYARVKTAIWADDDFRDLPVSAQHLYFVLLTSASLSYCGVADWRPRRIASGAGDWGPYGVVEAARLLHDGLYIVVDEETEEVLIRSFIRHDGLMDQPNVAAAMVRDYGMIASTHIRGVVVHELRRLFDEHPELKGWKDAKTGKERGFLLLGNPSVNPSGNPSGWGSVNPFAMPDETLTETLPVTLAPLLTPSPTPTPDSNSPSGTGRAPKRAAQLPADWEPKQQHMEIATEYGLDPAFQLRKFRDYHEAKGSTMKSWDAAFRTWLNNARSFDRGTRRPTDDADAHAVRFLNREGGAA